MDSLSEQIRMQEVLKKYGQFMRKANEAIKSNPNIYTDIDRLPAISHLHGKEEEKFAATLCAIKKEEHDSLHEAISLSGSERKINSRYFLLTPILASFCMDGNQEENLKKMVGVVNEINMIASLKKEVDKMEERLPNGDWLLQYFSKVKKMDLAKGENFITSINQSIDSVIQESVNQKAEISLKGKPSAEISPSEAAKVQGPSKSCTIL